MKRLSLVLAALCVLSSQAWAQPRQNIYSTKAQKEFEQALTAGGIFGAPRSTTALLPTCGTSNKGGVRYDSTTNTLKFCNGTTWASPGGGIASGDNTAWTGTNSFIDGSFSIIGSSDATKILKFEVDGFTTATTRTITVPNASDTMAVLGVAQAFTGLQQINKAGAVGLQLTANTIMSFDIANTSFLSLGTAQTPDSLFWGLSSLSNGLIIAESGDFAYDFAHANQTDPTIWVQSHNQSATQWLSVAHNATDGVVSTGFGDLKLTPAGHVKMTGTAPAVTACGVTPSTVTGSDHAGKLTTGSGAGVQSCTLTFAVAYSVAPACVANDETGILLVRATSTTTTLVIDSAVAGTLASQVLSFICVQGS